jgi:hypothetical protein
VQRTSLQDGSIVLRRVDLVAVMPSVCRMGGDVGRWLRHALFGAASARAMSATRSD